MAEDEGDVVRVKDPETEAEKEAFRRTARPTGHGPLPCGTCGKPRVIRLNGEDMCAECHAAYLAVAGSRHAVSGARKRHYASAGNDETLCGRYVYNKPGLDVTDDKAKVTCGTCLRRLAWWAELLSKR